MSIDGHYGSPESCYSKARNDAPEAAAQRLIQVYEVAIGTAQKRQPEGVRHSLSLLRHTLDPSHCPEIVLSLTQLYNDCEKLLEKEDYPQIEEILESIKGLWLARMRIDALLIQE